ncbi:MAG: dUTP diphosphatase [Planctomycetes bacterium]|nr:dUTP diphosphatase [Planctomycetota bacterium]MCH7603443.1 dUTP diphosphatase [Planctomycetota bacterium]
MNRIPLRINRLNSLAELPDYQSDHAAGMDLHAALSEPVTIESGEIRIIPCGFAMALPEGYEAQIRPRSGLACKHGISVPNAPGTIDADYRGEVKVALINHGKTPFTVEPKMRIAQMVVSEVARCEIQDVEELDTTVRGAGGFGSTGH